MAAHGTFNGLQKMMLRWEEFHAVNAAHIVQLGLIQAADVIERVVVDTCQALGMGPVQFCSRRTRFDYSDGSTVPLPFEHRTTTAQDPLPGLESLLDEQLNAPFASGCHWPLRFVLIETRESAGDSAQCGQPLQHLALVYQHAISDSRGMSILMREVLRGLSRGHVDCGPMHLLAPSMPKMFPRDLGWTRWPHLAWETVQEIVASRDCLKPAERSATDHCVASAIQCTDLPTAMLTQSARACGGTVQDLLFAALLEALHFHFWEDLSRSRRQSLAVYAPVDLRHESSMDVSHVLGQILGCMTVRTSLRRPMQFGRLVERVTAQTRHLKRCGSYRTHSAHMDVMSRLWDVLPRHINRWLGPSTCPIAAFISNVNATTFLERELTDGVVRDYFRATGTGIMVPMMLGITTLGPMVNITTTHRCNVFDRADMARISAHVVRRLSGELADSANLDDYYSPPRSAA